MTIDPITQNAFGGLIGKPCCRQRVGQGRSLSLGFGKRVLHSKAKAPDPFYGEWEVGTYTAAWRVVHGERVACGSSDVVDSIDELNTRLQTIKFGSVLAVESISRFDIRVSLSDNVFVDFIYASAEDDEIFHIFGPEDLYVEYAYPDGWRVGKSNVPWS